MTNIKAALGAEAPELTITGAINMIGEHTITVKVGKVDVVIAVSVRAPDGVVVTPVAEQDRYARPTDALAEPSPFAKGPAPRVAQFGTEFTFTNPQMYQEARAMASGGMQEKRSAENSLQQKKWKEAVVARKPDDLSSVHELTDKDGYPSIQFTYTDGWWYRCSLDVACIETQTYRMSLADAEARGWLARLERDVFAVATELGLETHVMTGGGHLDLDLETSFGGDFELFRNFLVDFANHPLALEALENDPTNAPVIGQLQHDVRFRFFKLIGQFDATKLADKYRTGNDAIVALADALQYGVYKHAFSHLPNHEQFDEPWKYQAVNVTRIADPRQAMADKTVEIRALRAQRSVGELLLVARLLQARIAMLKAEHTGERIAYDVDATRPQGHSDPAVVIEAFRAYVEQAGLAFADYEALVHANLAERHEGWAPPEPGGDHAGGGGGGGDGRGRPGPSPVGASHGDAGDLEMREHDRRDAEDNTEQTQVGPGDQRYRLSGAQIELLRQRGLRLTGTPPNGDCIYNSVSESAGLGMDAGQLREVAAIWCETHRALILETQLAHIDEAHRDEAFDDAVAAIRASGERKFLGEHGDLSVMAMSAYLRGRGVTVLHPDGRLVQLSDGADPIVLVHVPVPLPHYYGTLPA